MRSQGSCFPISRGSSSGSGPYCHVVLNAPRKQSISLLFFRVLAASEGRAATAEADNRRGSEVYCCFLSFPASPFVSNRLRVGAALQTLDNTRGARALDGPDVDRRVVEVRAEIILERLCQTRCGYHFFSFARCSSFSSHVECGDDHFLQSEVPRYHIVCKPGHPECTCIREFDQVSLHMVTSCSDCVFIEHSQDSAGIWKSSGYNRCAFVTLEELTKVRVEYSEALEIAHHSPSDVLRFEAVFS